MDNNEILEVSNKSTLMKFLMWIFIIITVISVFVSFALGQQQGVVFYLGFVLVFPLGACILYFRSKMLKYKALYQIKTGWGKTIDRKRKLVDIKKLHEFLKTEQKEEFFIDDQTSEDLDLAKIFEKLDFTLSVPGEQMLYHILRSPMFDEAILADRGKIIKLFQSNNALREKIQLELYLLGRQFKTTITDFLWGELPPKSKITFFFNIMASLPIIIIILMPFYGIQLGALIVFIFFINMLIHSKFRNKINQHVDSMGYLSSLINAAKNLKTVDEPLLERYMNIFKSDTKYAKASKNTSIIGSIEGLDLIADYINILFLNKERKFYSVLDELIKYRKELQRIYISLGELDALISIASYRTNIKSYVEPELREDGRFLKAENIVHPLIENPVPNSIAIENGGIVLTGSNMSGKSTFLRTVGINALFAQTICTCLAKSYSGSYFKLLSSISPSDNLLVGKSYYLGEAEAVLRIIKSCEKVTPTLCIIDEIFRGTNPIERIGASASILDYLINNNCVPIVATHDLELTEMVDKHAYACYYFTEDVDSEGLKFDYLIRKGVSNTRNAIKLLKYLGYPDEIIENTYNRLENMI